MSEGITAIFKKYDVNGDGQISPAELKRVIQKLDPNFGDDCIDEILGSMDANEDGMVQYEEFLNWVMAGSDEDAGATNVFKAINAPFMQMHAPNGQTWAEYCGPVKPDYSASGDLQGAWAECMRFAVIFELTNPDWYERPEYKANGPGGYIIEYLIYCGYGDHIGALEKAECSARDELQAASDPDSRAFLQHKARNGSTWEAYLAKAEVRTQDADCGSIVCGAWGEALTSAAIFEAENVQWNLLGPYSADGPCGQIFNYLAEMGQNDYFEALQNLEAATHAALRNGEPLPVFDKTTYQVPVGVQPAEDIGVPVDDPPPPPSDRKKALLIGCNYPGSSAQLSGCLNDVARWKSTLASMYGFGDDDFLILIDEGEKDPKKKPLRANILNACRWLVDGAEPGDVLVFQFSGHGGQKTCANSTEADGKDECLIPTDYTTAGVLVDHELFDLMVVPLKSGVKLTVILDCCHSGSALDLPFEWQQESSEWAKAAYPWHSAGDVQMFSGCEDEQCSMDAYRHGKPGGAMTTALCDVLEAKSGEELTYPDLLIELHKVLKERNFEQKPRLSSSQAFDPTEKVFSFTDGIEPNRNAELGQGQEPPPKSERPNAAGFDW